jgi:hypothetical protein
MTMRGSLGPRAVATAKSDGPSERRDGYRRAKVWLEAASETERSNLAAALAGGELVITLEIATLPTLSAMLDGHRTSDSLEIDFANSEWLTGFRDAIVEEIAEPG